jgi:hypothetical protein
VKGWLPAAAAVRSASLCRQAARGDH